MLSEALVLLLAFLLSKFVEIFELSIKDEAVSSHEAISSQSLRHTQHIVGSKRLLVLRPVDQQWTVVWVELA